VLIGRGGSIMFLFSKVNRIFDRIVLYMGQFKSC